MLSLHYHGMNRKIEEHGGKKIYLMVDDCILAKVLDGIKEKIGTEKFDNSNILIDTDDKLPDDTLKNVILMTRVIL